MSQSISRAAARQIILNSQLLNPSRNFSGKDGVFASLMHLGYIQIDTINVVQRAHHHTLWTRVPDYHPHMVHELQIAGAVFEYWGHAMSYLPMADYRFYLPRMRWFENPTHPWFKQRQELYGAHTAAVLERLKNEGPLASSDFERDSGEKSGPWFEHKSAKGALELLFWRGDIMIKERRNFHKVYDLTERVLPKTIDTSFPSKEEWGTFFVRRALSALGVAREQDISDYIETTDKKVLSTCLYNLLEEGMVVKLQIEGLENDYFAFSEILVNPPKVMADKTLHVLSPFDNAVISRDRLQRLFNFQYTLECYLPAAKRQFGYFALPILYGDHFIGKIDAKAERSTKRLVVHAIDIDKHVLSDEVIHALARKLEALARFNQCDHLFFAETNKLTEKLCQLIAPE